MRKALNTIERTFSSATNTTIQLILKYDPDNKTDLTEELFQDIERTIQAGKLFIIEDDNKGLTACDTPLINNRFFWLTDIDLNKTVFGESDQVLKLVICCTLWRDEREASKEGEEAAREILKAIL